MIHSKASESDGRELYTTRANAQHCACCSQACVCTTMDTISWSPIWAVCVDGASWSRLDLDIERCDRGQPVFWPTASRLRSCCCETFTFSNNLNLLSSLSGQTSDVLTYWRSRMPLRSSAILVELSAKTALNEDWNENYNQSGGTKEIQGFGCPSGFNQVEVEATSNQPDTA